MVGPNLPFGGLACGLVLGPLPSPPQRLTRSMFKALGARGQLFSLFVISLVEGA